MRGRRENAIIRLDFGHADAEGGEGMPEDRMERFIAAAERMRLDEYVRYESDRRRRLWDAFWQGAARGLGMMVGFAVLGAAVLYFLQDLAQRNLPLIGDFVAQVVTLVRLRLQ